MIKSTHIIFLLIFLPSMLANHLYGQEKEISKADSKFRLFQYTSAIVLYEKAIEKFEEEAQQKQYATFKIAECYRLMNDPDAAEPYYAELIKNGFGDKYPVVYLRYASILQAKGNISEARSYYKKHLKNDAGNKASKLGVRSCDWILDNQMNRAPAKIVPLSGINSAEDDFSPDYLDASFDALVFTSNRSGASGKHTDQWSGLGFSDLFSSTQSNNGWSSPVLLPGGDEINSESHEGTPNLTNNKKTIYFTRCDRMTDKRKYCRILKSDLEEGRWSEPELILADSTANIGHPCISSDELSMIFASNKAGGKGAKDLWISKRNSKQEAFGKAVNLGKVINTFGDEMFPHLYSDTILYFASSGHPGYGGLDMFVSVLRDSKWSKAVNLFAPLNSGYDDYGICIETPDGSGFFSSNRPGGMGGDDILRFEQSEYQYSISGEINDHMTLLKIEGASVYCICTDSGDSLVALTDSEGRFSFDSTLIKKDCRYEMIFKKHNYFSGKDELSTSGYQGDQEFFVNVFLEPIPEKPIVLPDILFPLNESTLEPQYQDSLMQLVDILNLNETLVIELRSHTDSRASDAYNDNLSQERAQAVVDFLISKNIDPGRLVPKGYGERIPRTLHKDIKKDGFLFKTGIQLTDEYVNSLPTTDIKEAAFHLNRRTEFAVLSKDYEPGLKQGGNLPEIEMISDSAGIIIDYTLNDAEIIQIPCYINDFSTEANIQFTQKATRIHIDIVMSLLQKGGIDRDDFEGNYEDLMQEGIIADQAILKLNKIRLGSIVFDNTKVIVSHDGPAVLNIGSDLLNSAGSFEINRLQQQIIFR